MVIVCPPPSPMTPTMGAVDGERSSPTLEAGLRTPISMKMRLCNDSSTMLRHVLGYPTIPKTNVAGLVFPRMLSNASLSSLPSPTRVVLTSPRSPMMMIPSPPMNRTMTNPKTMLLPSLRLTKPRLCDGILVMAILRRVVQMPCHSCQCVHVLLMQVLQWLNWKLFQLDPK